MKYKAFISYSHAADNLLAPALQSALHRFAKPFYRLRAVRVFRDKTSLHLTPELWPDIQKALNESEYLILLASPDAAQSPWVQAEINEWLRLKNNSVEQLLIVLTGGEIKWDNAVNDFDWNKTTSLPLNLKNIFRQEPLHSDLRWAKGSTDLSLRNPQFLDDVGTLGAKLHNKEKDEMIGNDVRQHRLFKLLAAVVGVLLLALTISAVGTALYANRKRVEAENQKALAEEQRQNAIEAAERERVAAEKERIARENEMQQREKAERAAKGERVARQEAQEKRLEAERQRQIAEEKRQEAERENRIAQSREVAASAISQLQVDPELSLLLSIQARGILQTSESEDALRRSLLESPVRKTIPNYGGGKTEFSPDGNWLVYKTDGLQVLETKTWRKVELDDNAKSTLAVAFSPDSKMMVTTNIKDGKKVARIWKTESWKKGDEFPVKKTGAYEAVFSPDNKLIAMWDSSYSSTGKAEVLNVTGQSLVTFGDENFKVNTISFSPDSQFMAVIGWGPRTGSRARVLETTTGRTISELGNQSAFNIAVSPDGNYLAVNYSDKKVHVFKVGTWEQVEELSNNDWLLESLAFSPDGKWLVAASADKTARVWEVGTWKSAAILHGHISILRDAVFSKNGKALMTLSDDSTARVWEVGTWQSIAVLRGHTKPLRNAAISPDGNYVMTGSLDETARIWEVSAGRDKLEIEGMEPIRGEQLPTMTFSPDGRLVVTNGGRFNDIYDISAGQKRGKTVDVWDVTSNQKVVSLETNYFLAFSPDGTYMFTVDADYVIRKWEVKTWRSVAEFRGYHFASHLKISFSPDQKLIVTAGKSDHSAYVWDANTGMQVAELSVQEMDVTQAVFSPDGKWIVTGSSDYTAHVWKVGTWKTEAVLRDQAAEARGSFSQVVSIAFSPDSKIILTGSYNNMACLWEAGTWRALRELAGKKGSYLYEALVSPDGKLALMNNGTAQLWKTETGELLAELSDSTGWGNAAFSADGKLIVKVNSTKAYVWDANTGKNVSVLPVISGVATDSSTIGRSLTGVSFSPDEKWLLTMCSDGYTRIFARELFAPIEDMLALARMRVTRSLTSWEREKYLHESPKR